MWPARICAPSRECRGRGGEARGTDTLRRHGPCKKDVQPEMCHTAAAVELPMGGWERRRGILRRIEPVEIEPWRGGNGGRERSKWRRLPVEGEGAGMSQIRRGVRRLATGRDIRFTRRGTSRAKLFGSPVCEMCRLGSEAPTSHHPRIGSARLEPAREPTSDRIPR